jgi:putative CocE/NonD family hydrolase
MIHAIMKSACFFLLLISSNIFAAGKINEDSLYLVQHYTKAEYQIPMRDGIKLFTIVYTPIDTLQKYPILFNRTPYNVAPYGNETGFVFRRGLSPVYLREGFIFVFQDVRGRFMSEGVFRHVPPFIDDKKTNQQVDEGSDAYDTIDWLIRNLKNHNGRVGMWGISYPGYYSSCAAINAHPALKCVSPQAPIGDWFFDDAHHHGAFFLAAMFDFLSVMDQPRHGLTTNWPVFYDFSTPDGYSFYKNLEPLSHAKTSYFGDSIHFWNDLVNHPDYDIFWQERNILPHLRNIKPAVMVVGGWYDAEDLYGTFKTYKNIENNNHPVQNAIVIGPWIHGGWARTDGSSLGNVSFGSNTSFYYRDSVELPFFTYYLKNRGTLNHAEATMFMTGKNEWRKFDHWPPENTEIRKLYLHEHEFLSFVPPGKTESPFDEYISDPLKPVPYTEDIAFEMTKRYMTDDQRFAARRPDVLVYKTAELEEDITLAGPLVAHLEVSTTGSDADWIVKLIDVYPANAPDNPTTDTGMKMAEYQQMVRSEVIRGRFRNSYIKPIPFIPGKIEKIDLELMDILHCFKKGHRIMIQIQSSWFPLVDINPQKYTENIFQAKKDDFIKASHRVFHHIGNQTYVEVKALKE